MALLSNKEQITELKRALLLCTNRDKCERICSEIHVLERREFAKRRRSRAYSDSHKRFQRTLIAGE
ncbi:hypothetical protein D3C85_1563500 [compost metagenome]